MSHVPPELSDYIIDFLHDDRVTLKACSLVSQTWHPTARFHLFHKIYLRSLKSCKLYCQLLKSAPALGTFTREVSISNAGSVIGANNHLEDTQLQELGLLWSTISPWLTAAERLDISFLKIDGVFQTSLVQNLNTITEVSLQYCRFQSFPEFVRALHSFPSLQSCTLRGLSWNDADALVGATPVGTAGVSLRLKKLILGRDLPLEAIVEWLVTQDVCKDLTHFSGSCSSEPDALLLGDLIRSASTTLREMELDWYSSSYNDVHLPFDFSIGSCHALEALALHCPIALNSTVPWVTSLMDQVSSARLHTFRLEVRLLGCLTALDWADLESRLLREELVKLRTVEVKLLVWHTASGLSDGIREAVRRHLPVLHSKGILRTDCR